MFAIGQSTVSIDLQKVVNAIIEALQHELMWPTIRMQRETQAKYLTFVGYRESWVE